MFTIVAVLFGLLGIGHLFMAIVFKRPRYLLRAAFFLAGAFFSIWAYVNPESFLAFVSSITNWIDKH
ncbi:hypothetical protein AD930_11210 [Acetobacter malorum]|nr:hypothetical protein AD930_11210 [Acetobacter malorum]